MKTLLIIVGSLCGIILLGIALLFTTPYILELRCGYFKKDNKIYFRSFHSWKWFNLSTQEVKGVNYDSFENLNRRYAKDQHHVFFEARIIENCDPNTFRMIEAKQGVSRDAQSVFTGFKQLSNDPEHFELLQGSYSKDRFNIYRGGSITIGFDVKSFYLFDNHPNFPADKNHIRYQHKTIEGADIDSFQILGKGYSKDKKHVYYLHRIKEGLNPLTFKAP